MLDKTEILKLAEELEALADNSLSEKSITEIYNELRKEAESKVDVNKLNAVIEDFIKLMGE